MSKVEAVVLKTSPHRPVDFSASALEKVLAESYLIADTKKDGVRLNLIVKPQPDGMYAVQWLSREGKWFPALTANYPLSRDERWSKFFNEHLDGGLFAAKGFMLDAELILKDLNGVPMKAKDTSGTLRRQGEVIDPSRFEIHVFGIVPLDVIESGEDYPVTHSVMKYHVEFQTQALTNRFPEFGWQVVESLDVFSMEPMPVRKEMVWDEETEQEVEVEVQPPLSVSKLYEIRREAGEEGLVLKDPNGIWLRSKRAGMWKCVPDDNEDGKVVGLVWGTPGLANEGKVIGFKVLLESGHVVNACKISKALMEEFTWAVLQANPMITQAHCEVTCINPYEGHTVKVTFMERYPDGSLRHPSFDSFRGISSPLVKE